MSVCWLVCIVCSLHIVSLFSRENYDKCPSFAQCDFCCCCSHTARGPSQKDECNRIYFPQMAKSFMYSAFSLSLSVCSAMHFRAAIYHVEHGIVCAFLHLSLINFRVHDEVRRKIWQTKTVPTTATLTSTAASSEDKKNGIKMVLIECDETAKSEWSWKILKNTLSMSNVFSSFRQMAYNTNWQASSDFLLKCLHVCYWCCLCILFGCQKIIYFVYGISWHWIYGQTIEPPGNSFSLCAHQTPNNCNENAAKPTAAMPYWTDSVYNILFVSLIPPENVCSEWIEIAISMPMTISQPTTRQIILIIHLSIVTIVLRWTHNNINFLFCVLSGRRKNKFNDPEMVIVCNFIVDELSVSLDFSSFIEPVLWPRPIVISDFTNT